MPWILPILSFVLGWIAEKLFDILYTKVAIAWQNKKQRQLLSALGQDTDSLNILTIASGFPNFNSSTLQDASITEKRLLLSPPTQMKEKFPESVGRFSDEDISDFHLDLPKVSPEHMDKLIEQAKTEVAEGFAAKSKGLYFNGDMYGVLFAEGFSRTLDEEESPILTIKLFKTDYFTHRVLEEVLSKVRIETKSLTVAQLNSETLAPFRTSLGVSVVVILENSNEILLTERSENAAYGTDSKNIYVSVTESFSSTDIDDYTKTPDFLLCVQRGMFEELGIVRQDINEIDILDMFFEKNHFQDGIVAIAYVRSSITKSDIVSNRAKDRDLEISKIFSIPNEKMKIKNFISANKNSMKPQTIYSLRSYLARISKTK